MRLSMFFRIIIVLFIFSCQKNESFELDLFFKGLKNNSPEHVIYDFRNSSINSVISNKQNYDVIFEDAATVVLKDSLQVLRFEKFCMKNDLSLNYKHDMYTIIVAFHYWLNNKKIDIEDIKLEMLRRVNAR